MASARTCETCGLEVPPGAGVCPRDGTVLLSSYMARDDEDTQIEVLSDVWASEPPARGRNAPFAWGEEPPPRSHIAENTDASAANPLWGEEPPTRDQLIGMKLGEYELRSRIGVGGMGFVYDGIQPLIGKRVAVKVLRPELAQAPEQVARLLAEARAVNAIRHRGIIDIFGFGQVPDGRQYIVMEFLDGQPLDAYLAEKQRLPPTEALSILDEVLAALGAAHGAGVVHRDLKPSNIFLVREPGGTRYVKLLDFGLAKQGQSGAAARTAQTRTDMVVGTPEYMAPEQARGQAVGPMTDLYAMGVVTFEMVTGRLPFIGTSPVDLLMKHVDARPPRPSEFVPELPPALDAFILQMLTKDPEARPSSADALRQQLHRLRRTMLRPTRAQTAAQAAAGGRVPTPAPAPATIIADPTTAPVPAVGPSPAGAAPVQPQAQASEAAQRSEPATVPHEIVQVAEAPARQPVTPAPIASEVIPADVRAAITPSPMRRVMPVVIGAVAFLAVVGLLIWGRSTPTPAPTPPVTNTPVTGTPPDKPAPPTPTPTPPETSPAHPVGATPPPVSPNPVTPNPATPPIEPSKPPETGKPVAQDDTSKAQPPRPRPHPSGNVPGSAEVLDDISRLERDIQARLKVDNNLPAAKSALGQLKQLRAETLKARDAEDLRKVSQMLNFIEGNVLKR
ncbi:MAG: protein kinase domain-containing protein [Hyalangium sp.]|uniref:serine/threonine-protein kinase n=1 Tax=Hyalangium sp. TaxID=2028555 RepID=UPI00389A7B14